MCIPWPKGQVQRTFGPWPRSHRYIPLNIKLAYWASDHLGPWLLGPHGPMGHGPGSQGQPLFPLGQSGPNYSYLNSLI